MKKWLARLVQPYPFEGNWPFHLKNAAFGTIFVSLFLLLFRPFGSNPDCGFLEFAQFAVAYGLVTGAVVLLVGLITMSLPSVFREEKWVVWKEILTNLSVVVGIGTANWLFNFVVFHNSLSFENWLVWQKMTFLIGVFPLLAGAFYKQNSLQNRYAREATDLSKNFQSPDFSKKTTAEKQTESLILLGENQGERLEIEADSLLFIEAADNYSEIYFLKNDRSASQLLRGSLKKMEEQLVAWPQFYRCHRTFLVNLNRVVRLTGNAQGYKLHLDGSERLVPVSRSLNDEIGQKITNR